MNAYLNQSLPTPTCAGLAAVEMVRLSNENATIKAGRVDFANNARAFAAHAARLAFTVRPDLR